MDLQYICLLSIFIFHSHPFLYCKAYNNNNNNNNNNILLKLDYRNAFNTLRRDHLLRVVKDKLPQLYPFIWQLYSAPSELYFGDTILQSATGVQQGDPLGPALFSLSIMSLTNSLSSPPNVWYLDDGTLGGTTEKVFADFSTILCRSSSLGLELNVHHCK